jgi:hypothetical protein
MCIVNQSIQNTTRAWAPSDSHNNGLFRLLKSNRMNQSIRFDSSHNIIVISVGQSSQKVILSTTPFFDNHKVILSPHQMVKSVVTEQHKFIYRRDSRISPGAKVSEVQFSIVECDADFDTRLCKVSRAFIYFDTRRDKSMIRFAPWTCFESHPTRQTNDSFCAMDMFRKSRLALLWQHCLPDM